MSSDPSHPHRHPLTAAAVVGSFSLALVLVLRVAGIFERAGSWLREWYAAGGFGLGEGAGQPGWGLLAVVGGAYGLAWILFETPGLPRRMLLMMTVLVLVAMASVVLALWGVFWSPAAALTGLVWSGLCAMVWAQQHPMPCESPEEVAPRKVISIIKTEEESASQPTGTKKAGSGE